MILDSYHYDCTCSSSAARLTVNGGVSPVERVVEAYFRRFSALYCIRVSRGNVSVREPYILPQHTSPFGFPHRGVGLARASAWEPPFTIECKTPEGALLPLTPGSGAALKRTPGSGAAAVSQTHETDTRTSQTTSKDKTNPTHRGHAPVARPHTRTPERTRRHKPTC